MVCVDRASGFYFDPHQLTAHSLQNNINLFTAAGAEVMELDLFRVPGVLFHQFHDDKIFVSMTCGMTSVRVWFRQVSHCM